MSTANSAHDHNIIHQKIYIIVETKTMLLVYKCKYCYNDVKPVLDRLFTINSTVFRSEVSFTKSRDSQTTVRDVGMLSDDSAVSSLRSPAAKLLESCSSTTHTDRHTHTHTHVHTHTQTHTQCQLLAVHISQLLNSTMHLHCHP